MGSRDSWSRQGEKEQPIEKEETIGRSPFRDINGPWWHAKRFSFERPRWESRHSKHAAGIREAHDHPCETFSIVHENGVCDNLSPGQMGMVDIA